MEYVPWEGGYEPSAVFPNTPVQTVYFAQDAAEQAKYGQFYPNNGLSFAENLALMGVSKGFDAHFQKQAISAQQSAAGASYAGQNGRTYQAGTISGGGIGGMSPLVLLLVVGVVVYAIAS